MNSWSCLPRSFAIVLDCDVQEIYNYLNHDGSKIVWPEHVEPYSRASFHIQEMIDFAYFVKDSLVVPFELYPESQAGDSSRLHLIKFQNTNRIDRVLKNNKAVFTGALHGKPHAVAWDTKQIIDPNGLTVMFYEFDLNCVWAIIKSKSVLNTL